MAGVLRLDCSYVFTEADFWDLYVRAIPPDSASFFGRNLDALHDALTGGGPGWPGNVTIHIANASGLDRISGGELARGLRRIAEQTTHLILDP